MQVWRRVVLTTASLVVLTAVLAGVGLTRAVWLRLAPATEPWQRSHGSAQDHNETGMVAAGYELRERNARLNAEVVRLSGLLRDYESIRGLGGVDPFAVVVTVGQVVARSRRSGRSLVSVDVGVLDGVRAGMAALSGWSLIGQVVGEERHRSLVQLITDPESRIPSALYSRGGDFVGEGLLVGDPVRAGCRLLYIDDHPDMHLEAGMEVLTSGTAGRFPPDLVLGTVLVVERQPGEDQALVLVEPIRPVQGLGRMQIADLERLARPGMEE